MPAKKDKVQAKMPHTGVPVCTVYVYRKNKEVSPELQDAVLPVHPSDPSKANINGDRPWYCAIGFTHHLASDAAQIKAQPRKDYSMDQEAIANSKSNPVYMWELVSAKVNLTRIWSCSTATIEIARPYREDDNAYAPPVRPEDVIVVEMGYTDSLISIKRRSDIVFYGVVDTVKERGGSGETEGIKVTIIARDTMRYLMDNKIRGQLLIPNRPAGVNRAEIVKDLIYRGAAINYVKWKPQPILVADPAVKGAYQGALREAMTKQDAGTAVGADKDTLVSEDFGPDNCYLRTGIIEASRRATIKPPAGQDTNGSILIMDRFPLDIIKHFSLVETAPREFYSDHRTGAINWMYRRTDARKLMAEHTKGTKLLPGLTSHEELTRARQYFYRRPSNRANVISYTNEWTTVGSVTHFSVTTPQAFNSAKKDTKEIYVESPIGLFDDPHSGNGLDGLPQKLRRFTRNRYVYDESTLQNEAAEQIALALFTVWGRDIQTGMVHVPGDPTLEIGEGVQLFNMGLFGRRYNPEPRSSKPADENRQTWGPDGIHRVEAVTHLFAAGGVNKGYTTVFVFGPCDPNTGEQESKRLISTDEDWSFVQTI